MPASLLCDFENGNNSFIAPNTINTHHHLDHHHLNDNRALNLALEFNWLNLGGCGGGNEIQSINNNHNTGMFPCSNITTTSSITLPSVMNNTSSNTNTLLNALENDTLKMTMAKRSQNTTECVPVPSSEHVAEIVGRQGCKIKALRAKTNTYIKTPVRGEEPVFVVTGRKEDVNAAKREILSAAEHFSQIRAQRKNNPGNMGPAPNAHLPDHVTIQVRVPYRVVGLVVGPKGATIKRIQQQTNTYIITPSRDKDPVFEVTGLLRDVETARKEIEAHIAIRTGGIIDSTTGSVGTPEESTSDFSNSPLLSSFDNLFLSGLGNNTNMASTKSNDYFISLTSKFGGSNNGKSPSFVNQITGSNNSMLSTQPSLDSFGTKSQAYKDLCSIFQIKESNGLTNGSVCNSGKNTSNGSYDTDEGIGDSPTFDILTSGNFNSMWSPNESSNVNGDHRTPKNNNNGYLMDNCLTTGSLSNNLDSISANLDYNRRSSSLELSINSNSSSSSSSSCVSTSAPAVSSII